MHDEEIGIAVTQFVEVALSGDKDRAVSYARHLANVFRAGGDTETATQIEQVVLRRPASVAKTMHSNGATEPPPVDAESRLPLVDEKHVVDLPPAVLTQDCREVIERFIRSNQNYKALQSHGVSVPRSILFYGPPGCGKTLAAHYVAGSLSLPILTARADGLVSSYLGSTSKNIRALFEYAAQRPCVLFLDELDAIAKMRDDRHELGELKRVVISLLQNIDAANDSIVFVAATNHQHLLDPAVWRRFAYAVEIPLPNYDSRVELLKLFFGPQLNAQEIQIVASMTEGSSGADLRRLVDDSMRDAILRGENSARVNDVIRTLCTKFFKSPSAEASQSPSDVIRQVRAQSGKSVSQSVLAAAFGISQSQVSRILNKG